jgi:glycosyltransferase involved in cell wall biosynthesis
VIAGTSLERGRDIGFADTLARLANELGVADRVTFTGFVDPVSDLLAAADIVVNPARCNEAFGRVAIEALAAGTPVIATRVGAVPEILCDGEHALLVAPDDPAAIAEAVERLCTDAELSRRLVETGRELVVRTYREERAVGEFARLVDDVLGAPAPQPATAPR